MIEDQLGGPIVVRRKPPSSVAFENRNAAAYGLNSIGIWLRRLSREVATSAARLSSGSAER